MSKYNYPTEPRWSGDLKKSRSKMKLSESKMLDYAPASVCLYVVTPTGKGQFLHKYLHEERELDISDFANCIAYWERNLGQEIPKTEELAELVELAHEELELH